MIDLNADVKRSELELVNLVAEPGFEDAAARKAFAGLVAARTALETERFEMLLSVRGVLTPEQWAQIQEIRREVRRGRERPQGERPPRWREGPPPPTGG
jgi:Spy/CpxP family protein refolding chaperone